MSKPVVYPRYISDYHNNNYFKINFQINKEKAMNIGLYQDNNVMETSVYFYENNLISYWYYSIIFKFGICDIINLFSIENPLNFYDYINIIYKNSNNLFNTYYIKNYEKTKKLFKVLFKVLKPVINHFYI